MARYGSTKRASQRKRKTLYSRMKGRQNARRKYLLPKKGLDQSAYESGFFDFLEVFWKNSRGMNIFNLTTQVAKVWDQLLPKPKLNKFIILRDYYEEFKSIKEKENERKRQEELENMNQDNIGKEEEWNRDVQNRSKNSKKENESGTTEGDSKTDFDEDSETDARSSRSRSDIGSTTDDAEDRMSESGKSEADDFSRSESDPEPTKKQKKPKRKARKYDSYEDYLRVKNAQKNSSKVAEQKSSKDNVKTGENQQTDPNQKNETSESTNEGAQEGVFFPVRTETSFDRIVQADIDNQTELLKRLKICKPCSDAPYDEVSKNKKDLSLVGSDNSLDLHSQLPPPPQVRPSCKFMIPTNTLHVKNLIQGVQPHHLEEIFALFLNDIVMFHILETKYRGEAVVECKTVDAAANIWRQLNGVPYKKLPLILEFANKEDLVQ